MEFLRLRKILSKGYAADEVQINELRELIDRFPYFQALRIILLRSYYGTDRFEDELKRNIMYITDRKNLYSTLYEPGKMISEEEHDAEAEKAENSRTVSLIDSFLSSYDNGEIKCEMPSDYTACLLEMDGGGENVRFERGNELIDNFIENGDNSFRKPAAEDEASGDYSLEEEDIDDACFTETLAKIYIKQQRYDKAVEIIRKLSLKYPKKNIYFANQLKMLEKLIINNKIKE